MATRNKDYRSTTPTGKVPAETYLDAAPWAQVESWDPGRMEGARATAIHEYHAADVAPGEQLFPDRKGVYREPVRPDGRAGIALAWPVRRTIRDAEIEFAEEGEAPATDDNIRVEYWEGVSAWQGTWTPLKGRLTQSGPRAWRFEVEGSGQITEKVRWVLAGVRRPVAVARLWAHTPSPMRTAQIVAVAESQPRGSRAEVRIVNGFMAKGKKWASRCKWDLDSTLTLTVRCTEPTADAYTKADRTLLLFQLPKEAFAVAVDDVLRRGPVYIPRVGLFVSKSPVEETLEARKRAIASRKTILEEVRAMPDQTPQQAMAKTHYNPSLNDGPAMLSLACDNEKFIVEKDGRLSYHENFVELIYEPGRFPREFPPVYRLWPRYGYCRVLGSSQSWGHLGIDAPANETAGLGPALRIKDKTYTKGLGHHADGEILIDLNGEYERFECETGVQWPTNENIGSVVFQVLTDGQVRFDSGVMGPNDSAKAVSIDVSGARRLALRAGDAGDGFSGDMADWAEARLTRAGGAAPEHLSDLIRQEPRFQRRLEEGWLPAPVSVTEVDGVRYTQRTYVAPSGESSAPYGIGARPLGVVELTVENLQPEVAKAAVRLHFALGAPGASGGAIIVRESGPRSTVCSGDRLLATIDAGKMGPGRVEVTESSWNWFAELPGNFRGQVVVCLPAWPVTRAQETELPSDDSALFARFRDYWQGIMGGAMDVRTPDPWLTNVIRASQVHILMAARNEESGARIAPWIASRTYTHAIDSEGNSPLRAMVLFNHPEFARRAFDFFFSRYTPEGFMTTGYTLHGSGWHLRTLAEYIRLFADQDWLRPRAEHPLKMCRWIMAQREKTKRTLANGKRAVSYGLMPPGKVADWGVFAHYFYGEGQYCSGLRDIGAVLRDMGYAEGKKIVANATDYRREIERAFRYAESIAPAVPLRNGAWAPFHPFAAHVPGRVDDTFRSMADAYVHNWLYEVETGAQQLAVWGLLDPNDPRIDDMLNDMEDNQFLREGARAYPAAMNQADWFNMGGFAKGQPCYAQIPELYALRDDPKPFLRSYFNSLASQLDGEVLSFFEGFTPACINKTHETGYFLVQTRDMLLAERGDELWLAPLTPRDWLRDGNEIAVRNAPTRFGPVSYRIRSAVAGGCVEADIDSPTRTAPTALVLRLRHPKGKAIRSAVASDGAAVTIDRAKETVRLSPSADTIHVKVRYE